MRSKLAAIAAVGLLTIVLGSVAAGFSCVQLPPSKLLGWGIVAAEGVVESSSFLGARVRIDRVYVGDINRTVTVWPGRWDPVRGVDFPWTFYLQPMLFLYVVTDCGGSHPGNPYQDELAVFGEGRAPSPDEPFLGLVGNALLILLALAVLRSQLRWRSANHGDPDQLRGEMRPDIPPD